jgi:hypothetical protein
MLVKVLVSEQSLQGEPTQPGELGRLNKRDLTCGSERQSEFLLEPDSVIWRNERICSGSVTVMVVG